MDKLEKYASWAKELNQRVDAQIKDLHYQTTDSFSGTSTGASLAYLTSAIEHNRRYATAIYDLLAVIEGLVTALRQYSDHRLTTNPEIAIEALELLEK